MSTCVECWSCCVVSNTQGARLTDGFDLLTNGMCCCNYFDGRTEKNLYHTNATAKDAISDNTIEAATGPIGKGAYPIYMEIASKLKINISTVATCLVSI